MKKFKNLYLWFLIPCVIAFTGFWFTYWSAFSEASFEKHLHGLSASLWFVLIIIQPYLIQKSKIDLHRQLGIIALFIAGAVVVSALQLIPTLLLLESEAKYSFILTDFVLIFGFSYSVIMAVLMRKNIDLHARYIISSAFWAILPALSRLIYFPMASAYGYPTPLSFEQCVFISGTTGTVAVYVLIIRDYMMYKKVYKPYAILAITLPAILLTWDYFATADWWEAVCNQILK